jgi:putative tryptophan--tRNA ligase
MSLKKIFVNISCVYVEKGITFKISHKVYKLIMDKLNENILSLVLSKEQSHRDVIGFIITTSTKISTIAVGVPKYPKNSRFIDVNIKLPLINIEDNDSLWLFVNNLKEAVTLSFDELKVETNQSISDIFELIKEELLKEDMSYWILKNNIF